MKESRMDWSGALREFREQNLLTQEQSSYEAGVGLRSWQGWENGDHAPNGRNRKAVLRLLQSKGFNYQRFIKQAQE